MQYPDAKKEDFPPRKSHPNKKLILLAALAVCIVIIVCVIRHTNHKNEENYEYALSLIDSGNYIEAKSVFDNLDEYKDSSQLSLYCYYADCYKENDSYVEDSTDLSSVCLLYSTEYQDQINELAQKAEQYNREAQIKREEEARRAAEKAEQELKSKYADSFPELGMKEIYLNYTILGDPDSVEKCTDFDHLVPRARSKKYTWGNINNKGSFFSVTVKYRRHWSNRSDDYTDYPDGQGYVFSITYYDSRGMIHTEDMIGKY